MHVLPLEGGVALTLGSFVTVQLARFAVLHSARDLDRAPAPNATLSKVGFDNVEPGTDFHSFQTALRLSAFRSRDAAYDVFGSTWRPITSEEPVASAGFVLEVKRHTGECHWWSDGLTLAASAETPSRTDPVAVITTVGFDFRSAGDYGRGLDFTSRVVEVRDSLAGRSGLRLMVAAIFSLEEDALTFTVWNSTPTMLDFAYRTDPHRSHPPIVGSNCHERWHAQNGARALATSMGPP